MSDIKDIKIVGDFELPDHVKKAHAPIVVGESTGINVGVYGSSRLGSGVVGKTDSETPTFLEHGTAGVEGIATKSVSGVSGQSDSGPGVVGKSKTGRGIYGVSKSGIGVHGKGSQLAGLFEGNVELTGSLAVQGNVGVTGSLTVQGKDINELTGQAVEGITERITRLENLVIGLAEQVGVLMQQVASIPRH